MNRALFWLFLIPILSVAAETKVKLPTSRTDLATGAKLFQNQCALCHGPKGEGGRGPMLALPTLSRATDDEALVRIIQQGIRGTEMPNAHSMSEHDVLQTAAFVRSLGKTPFKPPPGNPAHGSEIFRGKGGCAACHSIEYNGAGPAHKGLLGRKAGTMPGFGYSKALRDSAVVWNEETLSKWLANPEAFIPGQKMFVQTPEAADREDLIAYLKQATRR